MDEFGLIANYLAPLAAGREALGLKDDAAIIPGPDHTDYIITKDALIEGVHFLKDTAPEDLARKVLGVNLSDMAAMGAAPRYYLVAGFITPMTTEEWHKRFTAELALIQQEYGCILIGGDTVRHKKTLSFSVTMIGEVPRGQALLRSGAKPGDEVWVSGTIGDAALGLKSQDPYLHGRYLRPEPRVSLGVALRGIANSAVDISDGLVADLGHIAKASNVRIVLEADKVPVSEAAKGAKLEKILTGGDDYELAFTVPVGKLPETGVKLTKIGFVLPGHGVDVLDAQKRPVSLKKAGFTHF